MIKSIKWNGKVITEPGCYAAVPLSTYHRHDICDGPSISSTGLRAIYGEDASPKHFYSKWPGNPQRIIKPEPKHFIIGRALHHLLLGEAYFSKLFCIRPDEFPDRSTGELRAWNSNRLECKKWLRERAREGRAVLTIKDAETLRNMAVSVENHPLVKAGGLNGQIERSIFWKDKETGVWLKWRPDAIPVDSALFVDLKTTRSARGNALPVTMDKFGYYRQAALGREACREVLGMEMESFTFLFVEKEDPWHTRDMRCHDDDLDLGVRENRAALQLFAKCFKENRWPGPGDGNEFNERVRLSDAARERRESNLQHSGFEGKTS